MTTNNKLGIIQTRGLGDILIALPIAYHYHTQGREIYWPILDEWVPQMEATASWVKWLPVPQDRGTFFYDVPMTLLGEQGVEEVICLYQALSGHPEFSSRPEFQIMSFDQFKYAVAQVPFLNKWKLNACVHRNLDREQALYDRVYKGNPYVVTHLSGSDYTARVNIQELIPEGWDIIEITEVTDSIWDWLTVLERAEAIVVVDSVFANLVDQMRIADSVDSYFIPRSHIQLTPVLGCDWTVLDPGADVIKRISVFRSG